MTILKRFAFLLLLTALGLASCRKSRLVNTSFYYWKTVYNSNATESRYFTTLHCKRLYVRIMDVDAGDNGAIPISPIAFKAKLPDSVQLVPVVFIVNDVLKNQSKPQLDNLASKIIQYVNGRIKPSGKTTYNELQIDCDWTRTTRNNYFYLLKRISENTALKHKNLSATLRLHQLKNQKSSGIPPVNRVMLMCYNMGNLRKYGSQNSILEQSELEKYVGSNLTIYPLPVDVGLPVFSWAVVFRQKQYIGIAKRLQGISFNNSKVFKTKVGNLYTLLTDLPQFGLKRGDEVRHEEQSSVQLNLAAKYIQKYISTDTVNIIYFHLDEPTLKHYTYEDLEKTTAVFR